TVSAPSVWVDESEPGGSATARSGVLFGSGQDATSDSGVVVVQRPSADAPTSQPSSGAVKRGGDPLVKPGAGTLVHVPSARRRSALRRSASATGPVGVSNVASGSAAGWSGSSSAKHAGARTGSEHHDAVTLPAPAS